MIDTSELITHGRDLLSSWASREEATCRWLVCWEENLLLVLSRYSSSHQTAVFNATVYLNQSSGSRLCWCYTHACWSGVSCCNNALLWLERSPLAIVHFQLLLCIYIIVADDDAVQGGGWNEERR